MTHNPEGTRPQSKYAIPLQGGIQTTIPKPSKSHELGNVRFSFKFYNHKHDTSEKATFNNKYPKELLCKLKEIEAWSVEQFVQCKDNTYRIHPIEWGIVAYTGFGLKPEYDENAWQFSIKGNKYGRVHGFFIENIFHVVWLDPEHKVYPGQ